MTDQANPPACATCKDEGVIYVDSMSMYGIPGGWVEDRCPDCEAWAND